MSGRRATVRSSVLSIVFFAAAGLVTARLFWPIHGTTPALDDTPEDRVKVILPAADPLLTHRVTETWGWNAVKAAKEHGEDGLLVLESFGDEAAYCLQHDAAAFASLARAVRLDSERFRLASGPWNRAVLDWAQAGKLDRFLDRLQALPSDRLAVASANPAALPLLCVDHAPTAHAMLDKYGDRAWRLFMAINFSEHPGDLERVAEAVEKEGEIILSLNEEFGLPFALLLVPPITDKGSRRVPEVVKHSLRAAEDQPAALALVLVNLQDISDLLDEGKPVQDLADAIDLFRSLPPVVQELAADHTHTLRLLTETWHGQKVGAEALRRCGPQAADLVYSHYASDERLKWPALVCLARLGWQGYGVFERYRSYGRFFEVLRRAQADGLLNPRENPPLIVHAIHNVARQGQDQIDVYAEVSNVKAQVTRDIRGPLPEEAVLEWVPGYVAYRTVVDLKNGYRVTGGDVFWASVDGISTATLVYGLAASAGKSVVQKAGQQGAKGLGREGVVQLERQVARTTRRLGQAAAKRESSQLARFGERGGEVAWKRIQARTKEGIKTQLRDRRDDWLNAGDQLRKKIAEEIGDDGARQCAAQVGYEPLYQGKPGKGMGFDHIYRDGDQIVVLEAKGSASPHPQLGKYRGYEQGTVEYTQEVAEWAVRHSKDPQEREAAKEVLLALQGKQVRIEVVHTQHTLGRPLQTRVYREVVSEALPRLPASELQGVLVQTPGVAAAWVRSAAGKAEEVQLRVWLSQGRGVASRTGIALWQKGSGPLIPRSVNRKGMQMSLPVNGLPSPSGIGQLDDFTVALMERGL